MNLSNLPIEYKSLHYFAPTGIPLMYELDEKLNVTKHYFLCTDAEMEERRDQQRKQWFGDQEKK